MSSGRQSRVAMSRSGPCPAADCVPVRGVGVALRGGLDRVSGCDQGQADAEIMAERGDGFQCHVACTLNGPFIVLFEEQCSDQPDNGRFIWEDADDLAAAFDLAVEAFEWIGAVYLVR